MAWFTDALARQASTGGMCHLHFDDKDGRGVPDGGVGVLPPFWVLRFAIEICGAKMYQSRGPMPLAWLNFKTEPV
jgi:hypothetical protein